MSGTRGGRGVGWLPGRVVVTSLHRLIDFDWSALLVLSVFLIITSNFFSFGYGQSRKLSMPLAVSGMA